MTGKVMLTVTGEQFDLGEDAKTELVTTADYYFRNGKHFILYDVPATVDSDKSSSTYKITDKAIEVTRKGDGALHMVFEENKQNLSSMTTVAGEMLVDIFTEKISVKLSDDSLRVEVRYSMSINGVFVSKCKVKILAVSMGG